MYDNNKDKVKLDIDLNEINGKAYLILQKLSDEIDDYIHIKDQQLKDSRDSLLQKKLVQSELERYQTNNNYELFSPIHNKQSEIEQIASQIYEMEQEQVKITQERDCLIEKKFDLLYAAQYIETVNKESKKDTINHNNSLSYDKGIGFLDAQEKERQRIARDLHDTTVQNLTSLVHKTELCTRLMDMDPIRAKLELSTMSIMLKNVINDMRDIIYNLKPMSLEDLGLILTVQRYANQIMETHDIKVQINTNNEIKGIISVVNLTIFRIIQEACRNTIKHAQATSIDIDIDYQDNEICVSIKDNGIGFDLEEQKKKVSEHSSKFGLSIMRERIALLSGTLEIHSEKGRGTVITVSVPITKSEGEKDEQTY
jgi:two-component system, NarL family, sensor histidine kinase DegS